LFSCNVECGTDKRKGWERNSDNRSKEIKAKKDTGKEGRGLGMKIGKK
jgi:hypothetical protein